MGCCWNQYLKCRAGLQLPRGQKSPSLRQKAAPKASLGFGVQTRALEMCGSLCYKICIWHRVSPTQSHIFCHPYIRTPCPLPPSFWQPPHCCLCSSTTFLALEAHSNPLSHLARPVLGPVCCAVLFCDTNVSRFVYPFFVVVVDEHKRQFLVFGHYE